LDGGVTQVLTRVEDHVALLVHRVGGEVAGVDAGLDVLGTHQTAVGQLVRDGPRDTAAGATVDLAHDDVLRHVHQTTGQVTRVGGPQSRSEERRVGKRGGSAGSGGRQA